MLVHDPRKRMGFTGAFGDRRHGPMLGRHAGPGEFDYGVYCRISESVPELQFAEPLIDSIISPAVPQGCDCLARWISRCQFFKLSKNVPALPRSANCSLPNAARGGGYRIGLDQFLLVVIAETAATMGVGASIAPGASGYRGPDGLARGMGSRGP
jgi:hypothetical protein